MRKPWLIELRLSGKTECHAFTSKREADAAVDRAADFQPFESAELFRGPKRLGGRKSITKYLIVDGKLQKTSLRTRYPLRAKAKLDKRQFSQIVDSGLMELGFTVKQARAARKAVVGFWVQELKQRREVLTPIGRIRFEVQQIHPSMRAVTRHVSYVVAACEAEKSNAAQPPEVALPLPRYKREFVLDMIPPELEELIASVQPEGSDHL